MKKDDTYRSQFRLPYDLYEKLKAESERNRRSLNAEIVARLDESFKENEEFSEWQGEAEADENYMIGDAKQIMNDLDRVLKKYEYLKSVRFSVHRTRNTPDDEGDS